MTTSHPQCGCRSAVPGDGGDGEHTLPGSTTRQGPAGPWALAAEQSPGEPNHSPKHTWVPTGKRCVSRLCSAGSYCAETTAPCTRGAQSLDWEAGTQRPQHGSPRSAQAPLLKTWVGSQKACGDFPPAAAERCPWESLSRPWPGPSGAAACASPSTAGRDERPQVRTGQEGLGSPSGSRAAPLPWKGTEVAFPPENEAHSAHLSCFISPGKGAAGAQRRGEAHGHESPAALPLPLASQLSRPRQPVGRGCQALLSPAKLQPDPRPAQSFWLLIVWMQFSCF